MGAESAFAVVVGPELHKLVHSAKFVFAGQLCLFFLIVATFAFTLWSKHRTMRIVRRAIGMLARAARIPVYTRSARSAFLDELSRARRYQRKLSVIVLKGECDEAPVPVSHRIGISIQSRLRSLEDAMFRYPLMGCLVRAGVRENDIVMYDALHDRYLLLMLELDRSQAYASIARIEELVLGRTGIRVKVGVAEYPTDAWTSEDLILAAESAIKTPRKPPVAASAGSQNHASNHIDHMRREVMRWRR
jgi:hypothetical protein